MQRFTALFHPDLEEDFKLCDLSQVPEFLKVRPNGACRAPFMFDANDVNEVKGYFNGGSLALYGALTLSFMVRRAKDLLLEPCSYQGMDIQLEVGGKKLPQLPGQSELSKMLDSDDCLVVVNGNTYKPITEVFGFQQVYDDSVKCIEALKRIGIPNETMSIYATPEEISVEIHPGIFGLEGSDNLDKLYFNLIAHVAEIREVDGELVKTSVKTVVTDSLMPHFRILLPGSNHPSLVRPRVSVGASHFAYGIAAFSDYCGKKRTVQESVAESLNWIKFLQTQIPPIESVKEKISSLAAVPFPGQKSPGATAAASTGRPTVTAGRFQALRHHIEAGVQSLAEPVSSIPAISQGMNKVLGTGWPVGGLNIIAGSPESGKSSLLMLQALSTSPETPVLYVSHSQGLNDFCLRATACQCRISSLDLHAAMIQKSPNYSAALDKFKNALGENLFFTANDVSKTIIDPDEIEQLAMMLPEQGNRVVLLDSVSEKMLGENPQATVSRLANIALTNRLVMIMSLHLPAETLKRPHFIEGSDLSLLSDYQGFTDSILLMQTEKINLRKFVAIIKGQVDMALVTKMEQKAQQLCGGKRLKTDTYSFLRAIHSRYGKRELMLYLYQPELARFYEIASVALNRA